LEAIIAAKPKDLFVFQDGAREGNENDKAKCAEVRKVIEELTNSADVKLHTNYSEKNLGCGPGPARAITWFFDEVEQGIIFEDDCLPSPTIFSFYEELLERYKDDERISLITGTNALSRWRSYRYDYFFSRHGGMTMGCWASWRRAWELFDFEVKSWGDSSNKDKFRTNVGKKAYSSWAVLLDQYYAHPPRDVWDYQWAYARELHGTCSITSSVNQMSNIGFGEESTHTPNADDQRSNMETFSCRMPLRIKSFRRDRLFEWVMYQRFLRTTKKPLSLRCLLKIIDLIWRR
jgi:hypothetical protein